MSKFKVETLENGKKVRRVAAKAEKPKAKPKKEKAKEEE